MSFNQLPQHFTTTYSQSWTHRIQRFPSILADTVRTDTIEGFEKRYSQLEKQEMAEIFTRHAPTPQQDATSFFRWLRTKKHDISNKLDEWDQKELGVLISPKGDIIENHGFAYNRLKDGTIIAAVEGNAVTGEDGDINTPLPASQIIPVGFNPGGGLVDSGLTFAKVAGARRIFMENDLSLGGEAFAVISPEADEFLVKNVDEARNKDFSNIVPIADGTVGGKMWMGFRWRIHTGLTTGDVTGAGGTVAGTNCLFYHKSQIIFGDGEKRSSVDILPTESHAVQCRTRTRMGALRREEKGVVKVETLVV